MAKLLTLAMLATATSGWEYDVSSADGPFYWQDSHPLCGGDTQSPINIGETRIEDGSHTFGQQLSSYGICSRNNGGSAFLNAAWNWNNDYIHDFEVSNNGHSLSFVPVDNGRNPLNTASNGYVATLSNVFGISESEEFCFHSFHLHWGESTNEGSEHRIHGQPYSAEVHFVHYSCDFDSLAEAIDATVSGSSSDSSEDTQDGYTLAVVAFLFEVDDSATDSETSVLVEACDNINSFLNSGDSDILENLNVLGSLIPQEMDDNNDNDDVSFSNFWYYEGSLTTPGCNPIVRWHVFEA